MGKRNDLIIKFSEELREKIGITPNMELLTKVTIGCGPAIFKSDSATVSGMSERELATIKNSFLIKKLGLSDTNDLDEAINKVIEQYGRSNPHKYRVVVYYLLVIHFNKEAIYSL
jgi:hypothetical protein